MTEDKIRYFVLSPGRTGSSLLSIILADAGANFGLMPVGDWSRDEGALELRDAARATRHTLEMRRYGYLPPPAPLRYLYRWHQKKARHYLQRALKAAHFIKVMNGHTLWGAACYLGYEPRFILSIREFAGYARSTMALNPGLKLFSDIRQEYIDTLQNGLLGIAVHGGCVVDFEDILHLDDDRWARRISRVTDTPVEKLLAAQNKWVKPARDSKPAPLRDTEAEEVYARARLLLSDDFSGA